MPDVPHLFGIDDVCMFLDLTSMLRMYMSIVAGRRKPTEEEIKLNELVKFFVEVKIHDHANYFVDSLWDHTDVLQVGLCVRVHVHC